MDTEIIEKIFQKKVDEHILSGFWISTILSFKSIWNKHDL